MVDGHGFVNRIERLRAAKEQRSRLHRSRPNAVVAETGKISCQREPEKPHRKQTVKTKDDTKSEEDNEGKVIKFAPEKERVGNLFESKRLSVDKTTTEKEKDKPLTAALPFHTYHPKRTENGFSIYKRPKPHSNNQPSPVNQTLAIKDDNQDVCDFVEQCHSSGGSQGIETHALTLYNVDRMKDVKTDLKSGSCFAKDNDLDRLETVCMRLAHSLNMHKSMDSNASGSISTTDLNCKEKETVTECLEALISVAEYTDAPTSNLLLETERLVRKCVFSLDDGELFARKLEDLEAEELHLDNEIEVWNERLGDTQGKLKDLQTIFNRASNEEAHWLQNLEKLKRSIRELETDKSTFSGQLNRAKERTQYLVQELDASESRLRTLDDEMQAELIAAKELSKQLNELKAEHSELKRERQQRLEETINQQHRRVPVALYHDALAELEELNAKEKNLHDLNVSLCNGITLKTMRFEQLKESLEQMTQKRDELFNQPPIRLRKEFRALTPRPDWNSLISTHLPCLEGTLKQHPRYHAALNGGVKPEPHDEDAVDLNKKTKKNGRRSLQRANSIVSEPFTFACVRKMIELVATNEIKRKSSESPNQSLLDSLSEQIRNVKEMIQQNKADLEKTEQLIPSESNYFEQKEKRLQAALAEKNADGDDVYDDDKEKNRVQNALRRATARLRRSSKLNLLSGQEGQDGIEAEDAAPISEEEAYALFAAKAREAVRQRKTKLQQRKDVIVTMLKLHKKSSKARQGNRASLTEIFNTEGSPRNQAQPSATRITSLLTSDLPSENSGQGGTTEESGITQFTNTSTTTTSNSNNSNNDKNNKVIVCMGTGETVPKFLRHNGKVRVRGMSDEDVQGLVEGVLHERLESRLQSSKNNDSNCPEESFNDFMYRFLKARFGIQSLIAEWGYNLIHELKKRSASWAPAKTLLMVIVGEIHEDIFVLQSDFLAAVQDFFRRLDIERQRLLFMTAKSARQVTPSGKVHIDDVLLSLQGFFPLKPRQDLDKLKALLRADAKGKATLNYVRFFDFSKDSAFLQALLLDLVTKVVNFNKKISQAISSLQRNDLDEDRSNLGSSLHPNEEEEEEENTVPSSWKPPDQTVSSNTQISLSDVKTAMIQTDRLIPRMDIMQAISKVMGYQSQEKIDWNQLVDPIWFSNQLRSVHLLLPSAPFFDPKAELEVTPNTGISMGAVVTMRRKTRKIGNDLRSFRMSRKQKSSTKLDNSFSQRSLASQSATTATTTPPSSPTPPLVSTSSSASVSPTAITTMRSQRATPVLKRSPSMLKRAPSFIKPQKPGQPSPSQNSLKFRRLTSFHMRSEFSSSANNDKGESSASVFGSLFGPSVKE